MPFEVNICVSRATAIWIKITKRNGCSSFRSCNINGSRVRGSYLCLLFWLGTYPCVSSERLAGTPCVTAGRTAGTDERARMNGTAGTDERTAGTDERTAGTDERTAGTDGVTPEDLGWAQIVAP
jgi:hypothetical protein